MNRFPALSSGRPGAALLALVAGLGWLATPAPAAEQIRVMLTFNLEMQQARKAVVGLLGG